MIGKISFIIFILIVGFFVDKFYFNGIRQEKMDFCESKGGEYKVNFFNFCYIKDKNNIYEEYKIVKLDGIYNLVK